MKTAHALAIATAITAVDQAIKAAVIATMELGERVPMLPFFDLLHARNFGVAFSFLGNAPGGALSVVTALITLSIGIFLLRTPERDWPARLAFAMMIGGAVGNLIDRVRLGYVTDYFYFHTPVFDFAIFNVADIAITCGAALLIADELIFRPRRERAHTQTEDQP